MIYISYVYNMPYVLLEVQSYCNYELPPTVLLHDKQFHPIQVPPLQAHIEAKLCSRSDCGCNYLAVRLFN